MSFTNRTDPRWEQLSQAEENILNITTIAYHLLPDVGKNLFLQTILPEQKDQDGNRREIDYSDPETFPPSLRPD